MSKFWKDKVVIVTGGFGFLGNHVAVNLARRGAKVIPLSRRSGCDLRSRYCAQYYFVAAQPYMVINCAAMQGGIAFQETAPADIFDSNMKICTNTLWAAWLSRAEKYVNIIPGCVYPGNSGPRLSERKLFDGALHESVRWYATPKRASIIQAQAYRAQFNFNAISLVLTNLYGPREHFTPERSHALAALIRRFYEAKRDVIPQVNVWGTGKPVREWTYVDDAVEGIVRAAEVYNSGDPMNIAMGRGLPISELAELIKDVVGYEGKIAYDTSKPDGARRKVADVRLMEKVLNWKPETQLRDGIQNTLDWFIEHYDEVT